jgi:hypothetical protein
VSAEKNADWWQGTIRGQTGLFPSTYVERIVHALPPSPSAPAPAIMKASRPGSEVSAPTYTPYRSTHAAMNPTDGGPNALGLQAPQGDEQKKSKYDHLKRTVRLPLPFPPPRHQRICIDSESRNGHPRLWSTFHKLRLPSVPVPLFRTS